MGNGLGVGRGGGTPAGAANRPADVVRTKQAIGALGLMPEDPFDAPDDLITRGFDDAVRGFQAVHDLVEDGVLTPGGPTERALDSAVTTRLSAIAPALEAWQAAVTRAARDDLLPPGLRTVPAPATAHQDGAPQEPEPRLQSVADKPAGPSPDPTGRSESRQIAQKPDSQPGASRTPVKWVDRTVKSTHPENLVLRGTAWQPAPANDREKAALNAPPRRVIYLNRYLRDQADSVAGGSGSGLASAVETIGRRMAAATTAAEKTAAKIQLQTQFRREILARIAPDQRVQVEARLTQALNAAATAPDPRAAAWRAVIGETPAAALARLRALDTKFQLIAVGGRQTLFGIKRPYHMAADAIHWWRSGSGVTWRVKLAHLRRFGQFTAAERRLKGHFRTWLEGMGTDEKFQSAHTRLKARLETLMQGKPGTSFQVSEPWEANVIFRRGGRSERDRDLDFATGRSNLRGEGTIAFTKISGGTRSGVIAFSGIVAKVWRERYNWDIGKRTRIGPVSINQDDALLLQKYSNAKPFLMESRWRERLSGRLIIRDGKIVRVEISWRNSTAGNRK